jgi:hypothetical protein
VNAIITALLVSLRIRNLLLQGLGLASEDVGRREVGDLLVVSGYE